MTVLAFVDTNIIVYAIGRDTDRREKAIRLITDGAIVSAQVINEYGKCTWLANKSLLC